MTLSETIHILATTVGATVRTNQYDGGQHFTVTKPGIGSVLVSAAWDDDDDDVLRVLRQKMGDSGMNAVRHEFLLDYGSGRTARVFAPDAPHAVRLASQGEPESITDITTGEIKAWVLWM